MANSPPSTPFTPSTASPNSPTVSPSSPTASPSDRSVRAFEIQRSHSIHCKSSPSTGKWRAYTQQDTAITVQEFDDPVDALEAAEEQIRLGAEKTEETRLSHLVQALQTGEYVPWAIVNPENGTMSWQVRQVSTGEIKAERYPGWISCVVEIDRLVRLERSARVEQSQAILKNGKS